MVCQSSSWSEKVEAQRTLSCLVFVGRMLCGSWRSWRAGEEICGRHPEILGSGVHHLWYSDFMVIHSAGYAIHVTMMIPWRVIVHFLLDIVGTCRVLKWLRPHHVPSTTILERVGGCRGPPPVVHDVSEFL